MPKLRRDAYETRNLLRKLREEGCSKDLEKVPPSPQSLSEASLGQASTWRGEQLELFFREWVNFSRTAAMLPESAPPRTSPGEPPLGLQGELFPL